MKLRKGGGKWGEGEEGEVFCLFILFINKYNKVLIGVIIILKCYVLFLLIYYLRGWSW